MSIEHLKSTIEQIVSRIDVTRGLGEEATKQALVLPLIDALGYDIWTPSEVCPEYEADFAIRKSGQKEKVDIAILLEGEPRVFIEVKSIDETLDGHEGQLARYFNAVTSVALGILTNGLEYRFFTDTADSNVLDGRPFHVHKLSDVEMRLDILSRFGKSVFSPSAIREYATELNYTAGMVKFLRRQIDLREREPSEEFVRWVLASDGLYTGRITSNVVERFTPTAKNALSNVLLDVARRMIAAAKDEVSTGSPESDLDESEPVGSIEEPAATSAIACADSDVSKPGIETTEKELDCFAAVKRLFDHSEFRRRSIFNRSQGKEVEIEIAYKDTTGYFGIYFNKPSWWIMRIVIEARKPWVGFNITSEDRDELLPPGFNTMPPHQFAPVRVAIENPHDLDALNGMVFAAFEKTIADRIIREGTAASA